MKGATANKIRRENAKKVLEAQLVRGTKPEKVNGKTTSKIVALSPADITRINKEIEAINNPKGKKTAII
jgi:hypothetical protein